MLLLIGEFLQVDTLKDTKHTIDIYLLYNKD